MGRAVRSRVHKVSFCSCRALMVRIACKVVDQRQGEGAGAGRRVLPGDVTLHE